MRRSIAFLFVILLFPIPASALRTDDTTVIIPIIGRFSGALGSQWKTDVFISNHGGDSKSVTFNFYVAGGSLQSRTLSLAPYSNDVLPDIVLNTYGLSVASGPLEIVSATEGTVEARARIYNTGNAVGEFGQNVPGIGRTRLHRQALMYGLSGINGNRVNAGVTNPNATTISVTLRIYNKDNTVTLHSEPITLAPHANIQFNDVFARWGIPPQAGVQIEFNTVEELIYGYASEVRNDSGDAIFIFGTGPNS